MYTMHTKFLWLKMFVMLLLLHKISKSQDTVELIPGDVMLAAMATVNSIHNEDCSNDYDFQSLRELTAVKWFISTLNTMSYFPGFTIGLKAYRTCHSGEVTSRQLFTLLNDFNVLGYSSDMISKPLIGILGPDRTQEAFMVSRFLSSITADKRVLQVFGSATGSALTDREKYSNFFRVIPPDTIQGSVISELLLKLDWNYVMIVHDNDSYGIQAADYLQKQAVNKSICIPSVYALPLDYRRVFSTEMASNPWLSEYFNSRTGCDTSDLTCWRKSLEAFASLQVTGDLMFEYYQVKATAILILALKKLHSSLCLRAGVCNELIDLLANRRSAVMDLLENTVFDLQSEFSQISSMFDGMQNVKFSNREVMSEQANMTSYSVYNYRTCKNSDGFCFMNVGSYTVSGALYLRPELILGYDDLGMPLSSPFIPRAQCAHGFDCVECLPDDIPGQVVFLPGDFYIVAVVPVNDRSTNQPLQCGSIRETDGADLVQSLLFAVQEVNRKEGRFSEIFHDKTLGIVVINSCFRELVIKERLIEFHKGTLLLPDGRTSSDILPFVGGYIGAFFSAISVAMYEVLSMLDSRFVIISPSNTSPDLSDRTRFPNFLRLASGQHTQIVAIFALLHDLGQRYIQVVYEPDDAYTVSMMEGFNDLSSSNDICIVNNIKASSEKGNFFWILDDLRKNKWATIVVILLQDEHVGRVLSDISSEMHSMDLFVFIGTDSWARSSSILNIENSNILIGSMSTSMNFPIDQLFYQFMRQVDPYDSSNPWLKYFLEERNDCYFDRSFRRKGKIGLCSLDVTQRYVQGVWVPFHIQAVYAFALGLHSAMMLHCDQANLCEELTSGHLIEVLKSVTLDLYNTGQPVTVFNKNGDGDVAMKIFQISPNLATPDTDDLTYVQVGRFDHQMLNLDIENVWILDNRPVSQCPNHDSCKKCFSSPLDSHEGRWSKSSHLERAVDKRHCTGGAAVLIGTGIVIGILLLLVVVFAVCLVRKIRMLKAYRKGENPLEFISPTMHRDADIQARPLPPIQKKLEAVHVDSDASSYEHLQTYSQKGIGRFRGSKHPYVQATASYDTIPANIGPEQSFGLFDSSTNFPTGHSCDNIAESVVMDIDSRSLQSSSVSFLCDNGKIGIENDLILNNQMVNFSKSGTESGALQVDFENAQMGYVNEPGRDERMPTNFEWSVDAGTDKAQFRNDPGFPLLIPQVTDEIRPEANYLTPIPEQRLPADSSEENGYPDSPPYLTMCHRI